MGTTQEPDHLSTRSSVQDITGQPSKQTQKLMSKFVINVSGSVISQAAVEVPHPHDGPVAIRSMGFRYLGSFSNWNQAHEVLGGRGRLFH